MSETVNPEVDEAESSRVEKLLAIGLVVFLLIGGFWILDRLGDLPSRPDFETLALKHGLSAVENVYRQADADYQESLRGVEARRAAMTQARAEYEFKRAEYEIALARGEDDATLAQAYETARAEFEEASARFDIAGAASVALRARLAQPEADYEVAQERVGQAVKDAEDRYELFVFGLRFAYALPLFGLSVWVWMWLKRRSARYLILATAFMGFAGLQAIGLLGQYGWYLLRDVGPIALSIAGSGVCVAGLVALRRWMDSARRVVWARLRRGQCPYCGFPVVNGAAHCLGCGRLVVGACPDCGQANVRESPHCRGCGRALDWA